MIRLQVRAVDQRRGRGLDLAVFQRCGLEISYQVTGARRRTLGPGRPGVEPGHSHLESACPPRRSSDRRAASARGALPSAGRFCGGDEVENILAAGNMTSSQPPPLRAHQGEAPRSGTHRSGVIEAGRERIKRDLGPFHAFMNPSQRISKRRWLLFEMYRLETSPGCSGCGPATRYPSTDPGGAGAQAARIRSGHLKPVVDVALVEQASAHGLPTRISRLMAPGPLLRYCRP
jgi:hypothetical protein